MRLTARAVQGVGAAIASPGGMSLLITDFEEGPRRNRALAVCSTLAGLGMATGMILGGAAPRGSRTRSQVKQLSMRFP
ncbi:hypothetical protein [Streptomyces sp. cg35]|uniref:hypothetical protein n=1 Tax=Streptomyces sp. cg35 TaxID=3421650 RepID=UPI003D17308D